MLLRGFATSNAGVPLSRCFSKWDSDLLLVWYFSETKRAPSTGTNSYVGNPCRARFFSLAQQIRTTSGQQAPILVEALSEGGGSWSWCSFWSGFEGKPFVKPCVREKKARTAIFLHTCVTAKLAAWAQDWAKMFQQPDPGRLQRQTQRRLFQQERFRPV